MRRTNKIIMIVSLVAVLLLGVGYAAIQNITLNIEGTATADPSQANFIVRFSGEPEVSDSDKVTASVTDDTNATINVEGLTSVGEIVTATYTVENASTDLSADLSVETSNSNTEYFAIEAELGKTSLVAKETTTLQVSVELLKAPISGEETSTIGVQLTAAPVQPGEEGSSFDGGNTGTETITLASVTNDNIGYYVDLGNNIVGTESTTDDWRILYVDGEQVYAILADYLPNSTGYAEAAGLETSSTYNVYSTISRDTLLTGLTTESNWSGLANGISGASVIGGPSLELLSGSYTAKNGEDSLNSGFDPTTEYFDLYLPHLNTIDECIGYWMVTPGSTEGDYLYFAGTSDGQPIAGEERTYLVGAGLRPVVVLSTTTNSDLPIGKWKYDEDSGSTNTLAAVTNDNIGQYINLGNNIVGTESKADDWRILYADGDKVYAILSDYLPNSTNYAANATLNITGTYGVYLGTGRDAFLAGLTTASNWIGLANGISGASATGTPTAELIMNSYNTKNGTNLSYTDYPKFDSSTKDYDLYVPHTSEVDNCYAYWLATADTAKDAGEYTVLVLNMQGGILYGSCIDSDGLAGVRPVVVLPASTSAELVNGVWTISK